MVKIYCRMCESETVQYFEFDQDGNMFIYPSGAGCTDESRLVQPGGEMIFGHYEEELPQNVKFEGDVLSMQQVVSTKSNIAESSSTEVCKGRGFNQLLENKILEDLSHKKFADETMKKIRWVPKMYREWKTFHNTSGFDYIECDLDDVRTITKENLIFAMAHFIIEVKKIDGSNFPGKTLYDIVVCVQFHLETIGFAWKLLNDDTFKLVKFTLDNAMKLRTSQGIGVSVKRAQVLMPIDEDFL